MKRAPLKIEQRAIKDACLYRDSIDKVPFRIQQRFYDRAKASFQKLCVAMGCQGNEDVMVHENLSRIVANTPRKTLLPGKDY